jgi:hypothetical protein
MATPKVIGDQDLGKTFGCGLSALGSWFFQFLWICLASAVMASSGRLVRIICRAKEDSSSQEEAKRILPIKSLANPLQIPCRKNWFVSKD